MNMTIGTTTKPIAAQTTAFGLRNSLTTRNGRSEEGERRQAWLRFQVKIESVLATGLHGGSQVRFGDTTVFFRECRAGVPFGACCALRRVHGGPVGATFFTSGVMPDLGRRGRSTCRRLGHKDDVVASRGAVA